MKRAPVSSAAEVAGRCVREGISWAISSCVRPVATLQAKASRFPVGLCGGVFFLEQQPLVAFGSGGFHAHQRELAFELVSVQAEPEIATLHLLGRGGFFEQFVGAEVPKHHGSRTVVAFGDVAFKRCVFERMGFDEDGEALLVRVQRGSYGYGPTLQGALNFDAEIVVEALWRRAAGRRSERILLALRRLSLAVPGWNRSFAFRRIPRVDPVSWGAIAGYSVFCRFLLYPRRVRIYENLVVILFFGPPGSGKGTQSKKITEWLRVPAISTGDLFRAEVAAGTPLGAEAQRVMTQGGLVGDDIVNRMLEKRLAQKDLRQGFLLDGYPRTLPQAQFLDHLLEHSGKASPIVLHLDVPRETIVERLSGRRSCPVCHSIYNIYSQPPRVADHCDLEGAPLETREDDREAVVRARLAAYDRVTDPVLKYYSKRDYHRLDGNRPAEEVTNAVIELLETRLLKLRGRR